MFETFGIKSTNVVAGFFGSVAALSYLKPNSIVNAAGTLFCGLAGSIYWTPVVMHYMALSVEIEHAVAFTMGTLSMGIIGVLMGIIRRLKVDPIGFLDAIRGRK